MVKKHLEEKRKQLETSQGNPHHMLEWDNYDLQTTKLIGKSGWCYHDNHLDVLFLETSDDKSVDDVEVGSTPQVSAVSW